ncbi:P-loop containing nucleoside triphosphate hydrolase protein [Xylogone sp. PMI_703]|nr:P-loop containing nucleoside triphosphate hydrolase protein [Xylogone sp. PMI_703]
MISEITSTKVIIYSAHVIEFLKSVITYYPQQNLLGDSVTVPEPFGCLLHNHEEIRQAINKDAGHGKEAAHLEANFFAKEVPGGSEKASHLHILLNFIETRLEVQGLMKLSITHPMTISFDSLWYLFKPGEDVYFISSATDLAFADPPIWQCAVISACGYTESGVPKRVLKIELWILGCDGKRLGRSSTNIDIPKFSGEMDLTTFNIIPARIWDSKDNGKRRHELADRGERVLQLLRADYKEMLTNITMQPNQYFKGEVVLDIVGADLYSKLENPQEIDPPSDTMIHLQVSENDSDPKSSSRWSNYEDIPLNGGPLTEHQLLLLNPLLAGFALKTKEWISFPVDSLFPISRREEPFKNLVIPSKGLDFIKSLALQSSSPQPQWSADFVHGKGAGHIVLLHGPPGVGKTYTVECIAEHIARPLINLTIADIGTEETSIESQLDKFFAYAERWKAILLIDEADIFLERRKAADIARNGIVSVFLRKTEYFSGMLFLTTNRVGLVDDAFISRAHIVIEYEALSDESRKSIWETFFAKLRKETKGKIVVSNKAKNYIFQNDDIKNLKWNGREIRNALQTAITLAQYDAHEDRGTDYNPDEPISITEDHFNRVADMSKSFKDFLFRLYGRTEAQRPQDRKEHL